MSAPAEGKWKLALHADFNRPEKNQQEGRNKVWKPFKIKQNKSSKRSRNYTSGKCCEIPFQLLIALFKCIILQS